ncbi:MAG TPA: hypothetical protein PKI01_02240 [Bacteroidales bacterium]|nr:hypothetical protein [Bacteroidales bacterium]
MNFYMLFIIIISLLTLYVAGSIILFIIKLKKTDDAFYSVFQKLIIGFLSVTFVYAGLMTYGNTVLWGILLVGVLVCFRIRKLNQFHDTKEKISFRLVKQDLFAIGVILLLGIAFFIFQGSFFYNKPINNLPQSDFALYSTVIDNLNQFGIESFAHAKYVVVDSTSPMPYHYPELWFAAMICHIFGVLALETQIIALHSILATILSFGMIALCRKFTKSIIWQIFSVLSIYLSGLLFFRILPQADIYVFANGWNPKTMMISVFFVWFAILAVQRSKLYYFPLLLLPIINIATAPTIYTSLMVFVLWHQVSRKRRSPEMMQIAVHTILMAFFIGVFYFLNSKSAATGSFNTESIINGLLYDKLKSFKIIAGSISIFLSLYLLYFLPILFVFFSKNKLLFFQKIKEIRILILMIIIIFIVGLLIWSISHPIVDSIQFFYLPTLLLVNIGVFATYAIIYDFLKKVMPKMSTVFVLYFLILLCVNFAFLKNTPFYRFMPTNKMYSVQYVDEVVNKLKSENSNKIIAFIRQPEMIQGYWVAVTSYEKAFYIHLYLSNFKSISLDALYTSTEHYDPITKARIEDYLKETSFYKFAYNKSTVINKNDISQLQYDFVVANVIKYILVDKNASLPLQFEPIIDTILVDPLSGDRFVFLNY